MTPRSLAPLVTICLVLVFSSLDFASAQSSTADPCASVGKKFQAGAAVKPSEFRACLKSFPFRPAKSKSFLNTLWKVLTQIYPYINISRNAPFQQLKLQTYVRRDLIAIQRKFPKYTSDFDFHKDVYNVVKSFNDGHTYWNPACHMAASAKTGLPIFRYYDASANTSVFRVSYFGDTNAILTGEILKINISAYDFAEVTKINGIPTSEYVEKIAETLGGNRDQQQRLNSLFLRPNIDGTFVLGDFSAPEFLPDNDTIQFTLVKVGSTKEETFKLPYLAQYDGETLGYFNTSAEFYAINCADPAPPSLTDNSTSAARKHPKFVLHNEPKKLPKVTPGRSKVGQETAAAAEAKGDRDHFHVEMINNETVVLVIPDFTGSGDGEFYYEELFTAYRRIKRLGAKKLLIDVSDNGGGTVLGGSYLTELFFPGGGDPQYRQQFKAPPFARVATRQASQGKYVKDATTFSDYDWTGYENTTTDEGFAKASQFFFPLVVLEQAGLKAAFSSPFQGDYTFRDYNTSLDRFGRDIYSTLPTERLFKPKDILILSNGLCFSTCAIFTSMMKQKHGVKIVTLGGRQTEGPFSYAGGFVGFVETDYANGYYKSNVLGLGLQNLPTAPNALPFPGTLAFVTAQSYGLQNPNIPAEFVYSPSQYHMTQSLYNVLDRRQQWADVITNFQI